MVFEFFWAGVSSKDRFFRANDFFLSCFFLRIVIRFKDQILNVSGDKICDWNLFVFFVNIFL